MEQSFLHWLPPHIREQSLSKLKGQKAVRFPAAYFLKTKGCKHYSWTNLTQPNEDGMIVKTAQDFLIGNLIKAMEKYEQPYEVFEL